MSLGTTVNYRKNGLLLAYIANRMPDIHLRKLLKVVYLIDEAFVERRGFPLTWFDYYAWAKGPVAPEIYDVKTGAFAEFVTAAKGDDQRWHVNSKETHTYNVTRQMDDFSEAEMRLIDNILDRLAEKSADDLTDQTHRPDSLWSKAVADNGLRFDNDSRESAAEIDLNALNDGNEHFKDVFAEAQWNMKFQEMLDSRRQARNV